MYIHIANVLKSQKMSFNLTIFDPAVFKDSTCSNNIVVVFKSIKPIVSHYRFLLRVNVPEHSCVLDSVNIILSLASVVNI